MVKYSTKTAGLVERLGATDDEDLYEAVRKVKNAIIGCSTRKIQLVRLGGVPRLVEILETADKPVFLVQAAVTLGSLAYGGQEVVQHIVKAGAVKALIRTLHHSEPSVVEAAVRALKTIYLSPIAPRNLILDNFTMNLLLGLTHSTQPNVAECAAAVLGQCCQTPAQQAAVDAAGGLAELLAMLGSPRPKAQEAALEALAALTFGNTDLVDKLLVMSPGFEQQLLELLRRERTSARLLAAKCLANFERVRGISESPNAVALSVLPVVARLCCDADPDIRCQGPPVLAHLVEGNEVLQKAAYETGLTGYLLASLPDVASTDPQHVRLRQAAYEGLVVLCSVHEASRRDVILRQGLVFMVEDLDNEHQPMQLAACRLLRALSKGSRDIRQAIRDSGAVDTLLRLLATHSQPMQTEACHVLTNLALTAVPVKKALVEGISLATLAAMVKSPVLSTRMAAAVALRNIAYMAKADLKFAMVEAVGWDTLQGLLTDSEETVAAEAMKLLANLTYQCRSNGIRTVLGRLDSLVAILVGRASALSKPVLAEMALLVLANMAVGWSSNRQIFLDAPGLLSAVAAALEPCNSAAVREAGLWCAVNLSWPGNTETLGVIECFRMCGLDTRLQAIAEDSTSNSMMKKKAETALAHLAMLLGSFVP